MPGEVNPIVLRTGTAKKESFKGEPRGVKIQEGVKTRSAGRVLSKAGRERGLIYSSDRGRGSRWVPSQTDHVAKDQMAVNGRFKRGSEEEQKR